MDGSSVGLRSIDCSPFGAPHVIVGTNRCEIHLVSGSEHKPLIYAHASHAYACAWNPKHLHQYVTSSKEGVICLWNAELRQIIAMCALNPRTPARSLCFSPDARHLAVGCGDNSLKVMSVECPGEPPLSTQIFSATIAAEPLSVVRYSPNGHFLVTGSHDNIMDLFACQSQDRYQHIRRCYGHSSYITHIDWSCDSSCFMSNCGAYEQLFWNPRTGKRMQKNQRDTRMAEWTCSLGFHVMGIFPDFSDGGVLFLMLLVYRNACL